jgi:uncharacterized membrane protein HdeD (DUF308 family)
MLKGVHMTFSLTINWWSVLIRGLLAILIGIVALALPGVTVTALVFLFAGYAFVDGVVSIIGAVRAVAAKERWGSLLIEGIAGIAAGVITVLWPAITALTLIYVIAAWAIVTGVLEIAAAVRLRRHISGEWLLALSGVASVIFGVLVAAVPLAGALVLAVWFGAYEVVFGALLVALGFRLRAWDRAALSGRTFPAPAH